MCPILQEYILVQQYLSYLQYSTPPPPPRLISNLKQQLKLQPYYSFASDKLTKSSTSTMDAIDKLYYALGALRSEKKSLDPEYLNDVQDLSKEMMEDLSKTTGKYLHNLHQKKPSEKALKKMIDAVPSSLSYKNGKGQLPVQSALRFESSIPCIPLLATEGVRHNVGGADKRGGLLVVDPANNKRRNVLELIAIMHVPSNPEPFDTACLNALKGLKESNLFLKQDIQDYNLLALSCRTTCQLRFDYLAEMDPEALKQRRKNGKTIIHGVIINAPRDSTETFQLFLATALKHHPHDIGLLFQTNDEGETAFECALKKYGNAATFGAIEQCIPLDGAEQLPILHRVVENAPQNLNEFAKRYPSSKFIRDNNGRVLHQTDLASGGRTFDQDPMFFLDMSDEQVRELDPGTGLYPFMVTASGETSDLSAVYHLLKRNPSLVNSGFAHNSNRKRRKSQSRRRRGRK
jgi:hypothetical protein